MARGSNPTSPNSRFKVWDAAGDLYSHTELAENWDTLDSIIGRPVDGSDWPPMGQRGIGGGLYLYIKLLEAERAPIGTVIHWWRPNNSVAQPAGYELMDGRTILAANHNFPGITVDIRLPDALNSFIVGADPATPMGQAGSATNGPAGAPGVTTHNGVDNVGSGGTNTQTHDHVVPAHFHTTADHAHTVDSHTHGMQHSHTLSDPEGGTPYYIGAGYQLNASAIQAYVEFTRPDTWEAPGDAPGVTRVQRIVPNWSHNHYPGHTVSASSRAETNSRAPGTSANGAGPTSTQGDTSVSSKELDNRPQHIALIPLMKVRHATTL